MDWPLNKGEAMPPRPSLSYAAQQKAMAECDARRPEGEDEAKARAEREHDSKMRWVFEQLMQAHRLRQDAALMAQLRDWIRKGSKEIAQFVDTLE